MKLKDLQIGKLYETSDNLEMIVKIIGVPYYGKNTGLELIPAIIVLSQNKVYKPGSTINLTSEEIIKEL